MSCMFSVISKKKKAFAAVRSSEGSESLSPWQGRRQIAQARRPVTAM